MGLPIKFNNVHYYRIAGRYTFAGDLFITRGVIYFFPEVDLAQQREEVSRFMPHDIALVVSMATYLIQKVRCPYGPNNHLWKEGITDVQFKERADACITQLDAYRRTQAFRESLPLPTRVEANEISNLKLGMAGRLSFFAQSDTHDFNIGLIGKRRLRDALWESGICNVGR